MAASNWGLCKECQWWQIAPEASIANATMGWGIDERLRPFRLRVSGNSGGTRYTPGQPARAEGSGAAPPTAEPPRRAGSARRLDVHRRPVRRPCERIRI
jgi:hypothetical protein